MITNNKVKKALKTGGTVIGCQVAEVRSPNICQMYATAGFDFIFIDMEHGGFGMETVCDFITAAKGAGIAPVVRVPAIEDYFIGRLLDSGACGVIVPHIRTKADAEKLIQYAKYKPEGERGLAPFRAHTGFTNVNVPEFMHQANENTMIVIMVEDDEAINNIDELVSVEGVDVVFIGTTDLSQALNIPGQVRHPKILKRIDRVIEACEKKNVAVGLPVSDPSWCQPGIRFLFAASDIGLIVNGGAQVVANYKAVVSL